jgi:DNA recombination protein RmuC
MNYIFFVAILVAIAAGFWLVLRELQKKTQKPDENQAIVLLQNQITKVNETVARGLEKSNESMLEQLNKNAEFVQRESNKSGELIEKITRELEAVGKGYEQIMNIAGQLKGLEDILNNPKQRGLHGELYLEIVLKNVLPRNYKMQYKFDDGTIVDAVVFYQDKKIPIDSKFSLENYKKILSSAKGSTERKRSEDAFFVDLKNRIDETSKYIKPAENTTEFAVVYIPAQSVYDFAVDSEKQIDGKSIIEYAAEKKVNISSPLTFYVMLQTILTGLNQIEFNKHAEEIRKRVGELRRHLFRHDEYLKKLGGHLGTTVKMYGDGYKEFKKVDKDILRITGEGMNVEPMAIEPPDIESAE